MFKVDDSYHNEKTAVEGNHGKLSHAEAIVPIPIKIQEGKQEPASQLYPEYALGDASLAVATPTTQPQVTEHRDEVSDGQALITGITVRWWAN